jgi:hypothetical protein
MDFTPSTYHQLLKALKNEGFLFQTFAEYLKNPAEKVIVLRNDVDDKKFNSLAFAKIQAEYGIRASYYFRMVPQIWDEAVIKEIHALGHEIGYQYETLDTESAKCKMQNAKCKIEDIVDAAYAEFCHNLATFRRIVPVETICMHGSPLSKFDNRDIWTKYDYRTLGILGEPYFDLDFNHVAYFTDTGRMWDGEKYSVRDKVVKKEYRILNIEYRISNEKRVWPAYHSTFEMINAIRGGTFPEQAMMTFHPQRWSDNPYDWSKELVLQQVKNVVKRLFYVTRDA